MQRKREQYNNNNMARHNDDDDGYILLFCSTNEHLSLLRLHGYYIYMYVGRQAENMNKGVLRSL